MVSGHEDHRCAYPWPSTSVRLGLKGKFPTVYSNLGISTSQTHCRRHFSAWTARKCGLRAGSSSQVLAVLGARAVGTGQPSLLSLNWVHGSMDLPVPSSSTWNSGESEVEGGGRESKKEGAVLGTYLHSAVHLGLG